VIVSPYARPGYVCPEVFDHASVLKLVEEKWNPPALTARDAAARAPLDTLDLTSAPAGAEYRVLGRSDTSRAGGEARWQA
jgi:phospholipase C